VVASAKRRVEPRGQIDGFECTFGASGERMVADFLDWACPGQHRDRTGGLGVAAHAIRR